MRGVHPSKGDVRLFKGTINWEVDGESIEEVFNNDEN